MRFLVDENLPRSAVSVLRERGHDVLWVPESSLRGQPDARLIEVCQEEGRILVTLDLGIPLLAANLRTGVVLVRAPGDFGHRQIAQLLEGLLSTAAADDLPGAITVVSPGRLRRRKLT